MKLDNRKLYEFLKSNNITSLYHANTVATSMTFIEEGGLLSREYIERQGLYQTPQQSDDIDKQFDVFDDIFLDTTDLHQHFCRQNHYGPVLFQLSSELLLNTDFEIWVTKDNPIYWSENSQASDNYFDSVRELSDEWNKHDRQKMMITIRKPSKPILFDYLQTITLDNPQVKINNELDLHIESKKALVEVLRGNLSMANMLKLRNCELCFCVGNYSDQLSQTELVQKFLPDTHEAFES